MSSLRIAGRVPRQLRTGPLLRQIRRESTNASQSSTSNAPSSAGGISGALAGGLVGGGVALAGGYAWYHFSGARTLVNTAHETKATFQKYTTQFQQSKPEPAEAIKWLRDTARSYSFFIPGARGYIDTFFDDIDAIHKKHGKEVDQLVTEAYTELKESVGQEGVTLASAQKVWEVLQKYSKRLGDLAGDATEDILNNHPALKEKVGGNIDQLKQMGEQYGPEAKKQIEETYRQIGDIVKNGVGASTIPQIQSLVQDKMGKVREMGNKLWDQGMEKVKPFLDKSPEVKKMVEENKEQLKQGNAQELFEKVKESVQSGDIDNLREYVRNTVNKVKNSSSGGASSGGGLEQYLAKIPGGGEIVPQLTKMYHIAQEHGDEAERIVKETVREIEDVLKKKVGEAQEVAKKASERQSKS
ncbi:MAG: hypothetical protein LQ350_002918 [Teloschistes chrysophthalmus]|nr:MAG: hypothetical protein LQ350_002918 [Niorma chrysophthalma]